jgi:hypothetical protein
MPLLPQAGVATDFLSLKPWLSICTWISFDGTTDPLVPGVRELPHAADPNRPIKRLPRAS